MHDVGVALILGGTGFIGYTYILYPMVLMLITLHRSRSVPLSDPDEWPKVSILLTAHDEAAQIANALESVLALDYPPNRRQILVVSSGSADETDDIVRAYRDRGVQLLTGPAGRDMEADRVTGEIVVNTTPSVRIPPNGLKHLIRAFADPAIGLTVGREIRVAAGGHRLNGWELASMRYKTAVTALETRMGGIVQVAAPCYAIRTHLQRVPVPTSLSRDVAAPIHCREWGYQAVFAPEASYFLPSHRSSEGEYERRVGTLARRLNTVLHKRQHLNPFRGVGFAWMLLSHEVCRWAVPWAGVLVVVGLVVVAPSLLWARAVLGIAAAGITLGVIGWIASGKRSLPWIFELPASGLMWNVAAMHGALTVSRKRGPHPLTN